MAFSVPSLGEVVRTVENGFSTAFYGSAGVLRVTVLKLLAKVIGGAVYLPLLACSYIWKNSFISTADAEGLVKIGSDFSLPHKTVTFAHGTVTILGTSGSKVPAGTVLVYENSGKEYELLTDVTCSSQYYGTAYYGQGEIKAVEAGAESNLGTTQAALIFRDGAPSGVDSASTSDTDGGRSESVQVGSNVEQWGETLEEYRARLKYRRQNQPQGGCVADYVNWCKRFDFVTDVFPFANWPNTNNVTLFVSNSASESYTVSSADVAKVQAYVNDESRKPVCSAPIVRPVTPISLAISISFTSVNAVVKSSVTEAIKNYLRGFKPGDTIYKTDLYTVAASASGDVFCSISSWTKDGSGIGASLTLTKTGGNTPAGQVVNVNALTLSFAQISNG